MKEKKKNSTQKSEIKMYLFSSSIPGNKYLTTELMP